MEAVEMALRKIPKRYIEITEKRRAGCSFSSIAIERNLSPARVAAICKQTEKKLSCVEKVKKWAVNGKIPQDYPLCDLSGFLSERAINALGNCGVYEVGEIGYLSLDKLTLRPNIGRITASEIKEFYNKYCL